MRHFITTVIFIISAFWGHGQILQPAAWSIEASKQEPKVGEQITLSFKVVIDQDWYLYSNDFDPDLGPMLTEIVFSEDKSFELVGEVTAVGAKTKYDDIWEGDVNYFTGTALFTQEVKVITLPLNIAGEYFYQVCSDIDGKCIPFDDTFDFDTVFGSQGKVVETTNASQAGSQLTGTSSKPGMLEQRDVSDPYSLFSFMIVAFLAGLAALLTPCVFPMIPMTVTFFTGRDGSKKGGTRKALLYGFFIILIYTVIGSVIAPFMGPEVANDLATGWLPNILFFLVFLVFALSFLGLFEITLPSRFVNAVDEQSDKGGLVGVFFMAFTLVLVSFSCTGPIVGSILVESAGGLILKPILGMFAFSLAFALPFSLFALFPNWLNNLPKSGGWLNSVKVVLGFLELAFAFKFLSIADQAYHWGILDREIYLAIWIVIFTLLGFYLLGKLRLPHDSKMESVGVPRLILAMVTFTFVVYMIPGLVGAPLKSLAGYLPPMSTHDFNVTEIVRDNSSGFSGTAGIRSELCEDPKYADLLHFPHGIEGYFDYDQAIACAKAQGKPLFIDFTGHGCVNCREMEARVWSDPGVLKLLKNEFVVVALYVDEKTELAESEWYTSSYDSKVKKSIGKQNADFQITSFNNNAQPYYVILDGNEKMLMSPKAYDLEISAFKTFLLSALDNFKRSTTINP
ncbi:MAG: cytochrome c biogenesis protein CcdA [Cyclobacteriaceae bacterium]